MKTIKEHLLSIKDKEIRKNALSNLSSNNAKGKESTLYLALNGAFVWSNTTNGFNYWNNISNRISQGEKI